MNLLSKYTEEACLCVQRAYLNRLWEKVTEPPVEPRFSSKKQFKVDLHPCSFSTRR